MKSILDALDQHTKQLATTQISKKQYLAWHQTILFEAIKHPRIGISFCRRFDIDDKILQHVDLDHKETCNYILKHYVKN